MLSKIIIIIAKKDFKDEEYFVPKEILEKAGFSVETVANGKGIACGVDGGEVSIDSSLENVDLKSAVALILIGGGGAQIYLDNEIVHNLIKKAVTKEMIIGAICIAPAILAKAGILKDRKATVWANPLDKKFARILEEHGAKYLDQMVVVDSNIVTADGPEAAELFAQTIVLKLKRT
jgi:protease I